MKKNETIMSSTKTTNAKKQKATRKEAKARRKIAQDWSNISKGVKYQKATARVGCGRVTSRLKNELFDGILMNLQKRNCMKSYSEQKRLLRRIVEKRQAQQAHHNVGRTETRFLSHVSQYCVSTSLKELKRYQMCA